MFLHIHNGHQVIYDDICTECHPEGINTDVFNIDSDQNPNIVLGGQDG